MKAILHVIDSTEPGGAETIFIELADRLRRRGYRSVVVVAGPGWVREEAERRGLAPIELRARGSFNLKYLLELAHLVRRERIDVIQSHLLGSNVYCALAGWLTRTPVVGTFHGMVDVSPTERFIAVKAWAMRRGRSRFVCVSRALAHAVAERGLLDGSRVQVVYNGIDTQRYRNARPAGFRQSLGLAPDARIVLAIGNLHPAKGYEVLVRAAAGLRDTTDDIHFVVAGNLKQPLADELAELARRLGVERHVHFIGFVADTARLLAEADAYVLSSHSEGFSLSTLEALAAGVPVVATRCGGPEEIVEDDVTALLVRPNDAGALSATLRELMADEETATRLREAGLRLMRDSFDIDRMVEAYETLYCSAWSRRQPYPPGNKAEASRADI